MYDLVDIEVHCEMMEQEGAAQVGPGTGKADLLDLREIKEEICGLDLMSESFEPLGEQVRLQNALYFDLLHAWLDDWLDELEV